MTIQKYTSKRRHPIRHFLTIVVPMVMLFIAIQYGVLSVISVRKYMKGLYELEDVKLLSSGKMTDSTYFSLYKEKNWLETRLQIAKTDSISFSVNLKDSLLHLELKGVILKTSKIQNLKADPIFEHLSPGAYHHFFGEQATGESTLATIAKVPLVVKKAPKDSTEYANQQHVADSVKTEPVHWLLTLDNDIVLKIEGTDSYSGSDWWGGKKFWWRQDFAQLKEDLSRTIHFKVPDYKPEIRLVVSEADAKAIYRALPQKPLVCIRF